MSRVGGPGRPGARTRQAYWALGGILIAYLVTGTIYSIVTPVFEAPDESFHFFVVKHIVEQRSLPVQSAATRGPWRQEGSQPPLYYLVGALLIGGIDLSAAEDLLWRNPQANIGDPANPGNKNVYIHPPGQRFPWHGAALAVHVLRFFSLALGAATVVWTWSIVRLLFPSQDVLPVVVAAVVAFIPQFLFITAAVNNDNAMTCLGALSLYLLLRRLRDGTAAPGGTARGNLMQWGAVGGILGLALLAKLSGLALLGLAGVVVALVAWHQRSWRVFWQAALAIALPAAAIAGWWYVRNWRLYGEPTGLTAMWAVVGRRDDFGTDLGGELQGLRYSFWGLFGWFSILLPGWVYRALDGLSVLAAAGLALEVGRWAWPGTWRAAWSAWRGREPGWGAAYCPLSLLLLALWLGAVSFSLWRWTSLTEGSQGRLLYPAMASIALFWVLGLRAWVVHRARDGTSGALALSMLALGAVTPWLWIAPHYAHPARVADLPAGAIPTELVFGDEIVLRGVRFEQDVVHPGEPLTVNLYWEATRPPAQEDEVMIWLRMIEERPRPGDGAGGVVGLEDSYPGAGTFPVSLWPANQLLADRQYVLVGTDARAPMVARLDVALYEAKTGERLSFSGDGLATIGRVKVVPRRWPEVKGNEVVARFDCGVSIAAYDRGGGIQPGQVLPVTLTWSVQSPPVRDYAVFVHLEDEQGHVWGYGDGPPRAGNYPTRAWAAGEVVLDEHELAVAGDAPAGRYRIKVGLYDPGGRIAAYSAGGVRLAGDAVDLGAVEVR